MNDPCPCCRRPFEKMLDYPLVEVRKIEVLPIPEVMDYWSEESAVGARGPDQFPGEKRSEEPWKVRGINRTPEIASACQSPFMQSYMRTLQNHQGQEVPPDKLVPQVEPDQYFRHAYPITGTGLFISLWEADPQGAERACQVVVLGKGPNMGSAGGPTLQGFGPTATIHYRGRLLDPSGRPYDAD